MDWQFYVNATKDGQYIEYRYQNRETAIRASMQFFSMGYNVQSVDAQTGEVIAVANEKEQYYSK